MANRKLMQDALDKWGYDSQRLVWIEELAEAIEVFSDITSFTIEDVLGEIADVVVCLEQMMIAHPNYIKYRNRGSKGNWIKELARLIKFLVKRSRKFRGSTNAELEMCIASVYNVTLQMCYDYPDYTNTYQKKIERLASYVYEKSKITESEFEKPERDEELEQAYKDYEPSYYEPEEEEEEEPDVCDTCSEDPEDCGDQCIE